MDLTIKAFYKTFWDKPDVSLTIFGDGIERSRLEKLIKEYNLEKKIILMGMCDRKIIAKKLMDSDCFILASRSETFGVAYIEALAAGVPVIATQCGGPEAFVNETNGMLVPRENVDLLSTAMEYMYINIKQFDKERISNNIKLQFSPEIVSKNLIKIYNNLI